MKTKPIPLILLALFCTAFPALSEDAKPLYQNDFEAAEVGKIPSDMLVIGGAFEVKQDKDGKYLELPGEPLDTFGLLFGPSVGSMPIAEKHLPQDGRNPADVSATARFFGTKKGRKYPAFGVSLNGVGGYRLMVSAAKQTLEFFKGDESKVSVPYTWTSDTWTTLRIQVRKTGATWVIEGKAWQTGTPEPEKWMITAEEKESLPAGRAGIWGSPYSGLPIRFDDLAVTPAK